MLTGEFAPVQRSLPIAADKARGTLGLDTRIPRVEHAVLLKLRRGGIGLAHRWHGAELTKCVTELRADSIDRLFQPNRAQLLSAQALDHRQKKLVSLVRGRKPLVLEEVPELGHVVGANPKDAKRFDEGDVLWTLKVIR